MSQSEIPKEIVKWELEGAQREAYLIEEDGSWILQLFDRAPDGRTIAVSARVPLGDLAKLREASLGLIEEASKPLPPMIDKCLALLEAWHLERGQDRVVEIRMLNGSADRDKRYQCCLKEIDQGSGVLRQYFGADLLLPAAIMTALNGANAGSPSHGE